MSLGTIVQTNRMGQEGKEKTRVHTSSFKIRISAPKGRASFFIVEISSGQFWEQGGLNQKAIKSPSYPRYFAHGLPLGSSLFWPLGEQSLPSGDLHPSGCSQSGGGHGPCALCCSARVEAGRESREGWVGECPWFSLPPAGLSPEWSLSLTLHFSCPFIVSARLQVTSHTYAWWFILILESGHYRRSGISVLGTDGIWSKECGV